MAAKDICSFTVEVAESALRAVKKMLDPDNVFKSGCRVVKRPDCCILCKNNNSCDRLPVHVRCHCKPEFYLTFFE